MIRVYPASKLKHAPLWSGLNEVWFNVYFVARWLKHAVIGTPDLPEYALNFWQEDEEDIRTCDVVLCYAAFEDKLRGSLVEVGMGIAFGKRIITVGLHDDYSTWCRHPLVTRVNNLEDAYEILCRWDRFSQPRRESE